MLAVLPVVAPAASRTAILTESLTMPMNMLVASLVMAQQKTVIIMLIPMMQKLMTE